jgi:fumarate reductase subunit C
VHATIGLRVVVFEWLGVRGIALSVFSLVVLATLLLLGGRAVWAVTFAGGGL